MSKETKSFSLDADIADQLKRRDDLNASAIVNRMLREYLASGKAPDAALTMRLEKLEQQIENARAERERLDAQIQRLEEEKDEVRRQMRTRDDKQTEQVVEVAQMVQSGQIPEDRLEPTATVIQHRAGKADMAPERFINEVQSEL